MIHEPTIRRAKEPDLKAILALLAEMHEEAPPTATPEDEIALRQCLAYPGRDLLVAELGPLVVGTADVLCVPNLSRQRSPWAIIENVVVAREFRRRGVGRALV